MNAGDGVVHCVAADPHGLAGHHSAQGDDGDVRGTAADIDDHVAAGLVDGQSRPDRRGHRFLDQERFAGPGADGRLDDRPPFDFGRAGGDAHDGPWTLENTRPRQIRRIRYFSISRVRS